MKLKYVFVITFISFNIGFAYQSKPENISLNNNKQEEYRKLINQANKCALNKKVGESLETAKKAYNLCPDKKDALLIIARIYNYKNDTVNLRKTAEKIIAISPENYLGNIYLANSYMKENKIKAKEILEKLLKKYPKDERIIKKLREI